MSVPFNKCLRDCAEMGKYEYEHTHRMVHSDTAFLTPYVKPTDRVLDVACGPGTITQRLARLVPQGSVVGVVSRSEAFKRAQENVDAAQGPDNITFQYERFHQYLPFPDNSFDVVLGSQLFFDYTTDGVDEQLLAEMRRVTKYGGMVATRDVAELHFYPRKYGLDHTTRRLLRGRQMMGKDAFLPGVEMPVLYKRVGFTPDGGRMKIGAGTTVLSTPTERAWWIKKSGESYAGDPNPDGDIQDEGNKEKRHDAEAKWAQDEDAWYVAVHCEICAWK